MAGLIDESMVAPDRSARPGRRRGWGRRLSVVAHRWLSVALGTVLVVLTTSGALLVYAPELIRTGNPELFASTAGDHPHRIGFADAIDAVGRVDPPFVVASVSLSDGVYALEESGDSGQAYYVDAGSGAINGHTNVYGGVLGFIANVHECALSCPSYAGYVPWLAAPSPVARLTPFAEMSWGAVLLGLIGLLLAILAVTGAIVWWPRERRWRRAFRVRWRKGRFARDADLHRVIGIVAVLPLLIWALTGMNFEIPAVAKIWYAATGGVAPAEDNYTMEPSKLGGPTLGLDAAMSAALSRFPGAEVSYVGLPADEDGFYAIDLVQGGPDLWAHNLGYRGNRSVGVDAHDAGRVRVFLGAPETLSNAIADQWAQPALHYGVAVNGWWRALWCAFGLTPLMLMVTGLSTWLYRRQVNRRRTAARGTSR